MFRLMFSLFGFFSSMNFLHCVRFILLLLSTFTHLLYSFLLLFSPLLLTYTSSLSINYSRTFASRRAHFMVCFHRLLHHQARLPDSIIAKINVKRTRSQLRCLDHHHHHHHHKYSAAILIASSSFLSLSLYRVLLCVDAC